MIGRMVPGEGDRGRARGGVGRGLLASALAVAVAMFAVGCDAGDGEESSAPGSSSEVGEATSTLEHRDGGTKIDGRDDGRHDPPGDLPLIGPAAPGGSPFDDVAEPDPIPWHRSTKPGTGTSEAYAHDA